MAGGADTSFGRDVGERSAAQVVIQRARRLADKQGVQPTVIIVIQECAARADGVEDVQREPTVMTLRKMDSRTSGNIRKAALTAGSRRTRFAWRRVPERKPVAAAQAKRENKQ